MRKSRIGLLWALLFLVAATLGVACSKSEATPTPTSPSSLSQPTNGLAQSSSGGNVTVEVKWKGIENGLLVFEVVMDTHSVDLDSYDLGKLATLRDDSGREYSPDKWISAPGGHHREGTLNFSIPDGLTEGKVRYLQLVVRGVAGVSERILKWGMPGG